MRRLALLRRLTALTVSMCGISDASMLAVAHLTRLQVRGLPVLGLLPSRTALRESRQSLPSHASTELHSMC